MSKRFFRSVGGEIPLPIFFPDATRGVIRSLDSRDIENTKTPGVLVNTYHLLHDLGEEKMKQIGGIRKLMNFSGGMISDSGGFQLMSLVKKNPGLSRITEKGIVFRLSQKTTIKLTPEDSIRFQLAMETDMVVVLDDFTPPGADEKTARESVERTYRWAERSKKEFERICDEREISKEKRPYLLGVVHGDRDIGLRRESAQGLVSLGFDGLGYGGWPIMENGGFDYEVAQVLAEETPGNYFLYGLGVGKPEDIVGCVKLGFNIFDCVLPTRDARHGRLYVFDDKNGFDYHYYSPKERDITSDEKVSEICDCLLCQNYSKGYLTHLFKIKDATAWRLATIHNLRFYANLMERLKGNGSGVV